MSYKQMSLKVSVCCLALFFLINSTGAKPVSELQSLKELLEEQLNSTPHVSSEELETGDKDGNSEQTEFGAPDQQLWDSSDSNAALVSKESLLARLLKDLMRTSKRSWSRYKKGAMRSCFGVRLERIGSFSGLGC
ncbi:uncharacterized protein V6R79_012192 [Siganus canaliculatus]